jgi:hypothetical protein
LFSIMSINYSAATMALLDALGQDPETKYDVRTIAENAKVSVGERVRPRKACPTWAG